ncbi:hypothetical protein EVB32_026 [Rhizobium phage RHph_TM39]|uniref:Uncharacterized protein n=1 Tax=Rhizobium phage RHph_Y65 TaxID=2509785 RepID=A0A7S5RI46_9CAUD|nr:hypothetical protein PQC17_gp026 [Rhizobium phage RHph_Y65]QIG71860.1 hypothetical protein EVB95_026 [Rhizobium phage RHph_TM2_3B]QIG72584.1 hypothetical protein EVB97_026 [Rhizobium phage RHph_Y65]QIG77014.1 hypothetical protein EVB32_026 [Rhizobium phage RHph_TM39]
MLSKRFYDTGMGFYVDLEHIQAVSNAQDTHRYGEVCFSIKYMMGAGNHTLYNFSTYYGDTEFEKEVLAATRALSDSPEWRKLTQDPDKRRMLSRVTIPILQKYIDRMWEAKSEFLSSQ